MNRECEAGELGTGGGRSMHLSHVAPGVALYLPFLLEKPAGQASN